MTIPDESRPAFSRTPYQVDAVAALAVACIVTGWFALSTLVTEVGGLRLSFHFYDMWSLVAEPSRLVTGLTGGDRAKGMLFGALCMGVVIAVFVPNRRTRLGVRVAYLAPLALMLVCGALLYEKTSADLFVDTGTAGSIGSHLTALANAVANRLSASVSRHISLGFGAYLALLGSLVLAARGFSGERIHASSSS